MKKFWDFIKNLLGIKKYADVLSVDMSFER